MTQAKKGSNVKVHYTGKLEDGTVFDSSSEGEPLQFKIGDQKLLPDFEEAVVGMRIGESKTIHLQAENAYGPHREEMVISVNRDQLPKDLEPTVGQRLQTTLQNGETIVFMIAEISKTDVLLDANHPLAGKNLTFNIELAEIL
jgi:FKBP-type peptidyl-prolyl cis-trans isomerase 2